MGNLDLMIILAQVLNFLILFLIFKKFVADKLIASIATRRELIAKLDNAQEEYRKTLEMAYKEKEEILKEARASANLLSKDLIDLAKKRELEILAIAEKRADMIIQAGDRQVEKDRLEMIEGVKWYILDLTLKLNSKLFKDEKVDRNFMKSELSKLV